MTRLLIVADMEGITGIERYEQCVRGHPEYAEGVRLLCQEVNIIVDTAFKTGAQSVSVIDWHAGGGNLDPDQLDERLEIVAEDLSSGYDLAVLIGFHPMAGDQSGFISHTMTQGVAVEVGGQQVGEIELITWWLSEHDIPVGLVAGDRAATAETDYFFVDIPTHTVKRAESWARATCVPAEQSYDALRTRIGRVMQQRERWQFFRLTLPANVRLRLREEIPTVPLIPWLKQDADGWISGTVEHARDVIDLLDVVAALMTSRHLRGQIEELRKDSAVRDRQHQMLLERTGEAIQRGGWVVE